MICGSIHVADAVRRAVECTPGSTLGLGMVGAFVVVGGCATPHPAAVQALAADSASNVVSVRLHVRPSTMASGTQTIQAGRQELGLDAQHGGTALQGTFVYVPPQCVGTRRVPLVMFLHGSGMNGLSEMNDNDGILPQLADTYGFILVMPSSTYRSEWRLHQMDTVQSPDVQRLDAVLRYVLQAYAIDPARIALAGESNGAGMALKTGLVNGDVISRVLSFSPGLTQASYYVHLPRHGKPPIFIGHGQVEIDPQAIAHAIRWVGLPVRKSNVDSIRAGYDARPVVRLLRQAGYAVTYVMDTSGHGDKPPRARVAFHWLDSSWKGTNR